MRLFGIILAGGQGRRMGGADKAFLTLHGRSMILHAIERLEPQVERLAISANGDAQRFSHLGLPVLPDTEPLGPLSGILAALRWARPLGATAAVSASVDSPFLPGDLTPRLCLAAEGAPRGLALAETEGQLHGTFGLWPVDLEPALTAFLASGVKARVLDFAASQGAAAAHFPDSGAFDNLNTPEDLARAEAVLRGQA